MARQRLCSGVLKAGEKARFVSLQQQRAFLSRFG